MDNRAVVPTQSRRQARLMSRVHVAAALVNVARSVSEKHSADGNGNRESISLWNTLFLFRVRSVIVRIVIVMVVRKGETAPSQPMARSSSWELSPKLFFNLGSRII